MPCLDANMFLVMEVIKDGKNLCFAAVGKFQGALGRVKHPAQDFLSLCPTPIPFQHLLFGDSFLPVGSVIGGLCKHMGQWDAVYSGGHADKVREILG